MFGWIAIVGLGIFGFGLVAGLVVEVLGVADQTRSAVGIPALAGIGVAAVFWLLWCSWSTLLDREPPGELRRSTKWTLAFIAMVVAGGAAITIGMVLAEIVDDAADWRQAIAMAASIVGAVAVGAALIASAIAGGVLLGGGSWWWVGVVLAMGTAGTAIGTVTVYPWLTILGVSMLVLSIWGYRAALKAGVRAGRQGALEAIGSRRKE